MIQRWYPEVVTEVNGDGDHDKVKDDSKPTSAPTKQAKAPVPAVPISVPNPKNQTPLPTVFPYEAKPQRIATLPPALWQKVWAGLDAAFFPTGHPELHMEGACKCGKLKFKVDGTLAAAFMCHCHMCRMHWGQATPSHVLWIQPETAVTFTSGHENLAMHIVPKLSRNLRGQATVKFCKNCGTNINVEFSDPNATFTLMWPYNFKLPEWGDKSAQGDKARHGFSEVLRPRFHAHYENRAVDWHDGLPKLADIWLEGMPLMNDAGEGVGKVTCPMPGFENGFMQAPVANSKIQALSSLTSILSGIAKL